MKQLTGEGTVAVRYFGGKVEVQLGDCVSLRVWFRKRIGRVVYVPGVSPRNPAFAFNGLQWVGIRLENGSLVKTIVLSKTSDLEKDITFIEHDVSPCEMITESFRGDEENETFTP